MTPMLAERLCKAAARMRDFGEEASAAACEEAAAALDTADAARRTGRAAPAERDRAERLAAEHDAAKVERDRLIEAVRKVLNHHSRARIEDVAAILRAAIPVWVGAGGEVERRARALAGGGEGGAGGNGG